MTRSVVVGSGIVGRAAAWDLQRRGHEVTVADISADGARSVAEEFGLSWVELDVTAIDELNSVLSGAECVVSAVPYQFGHAMAAAAIRNQCHYFDFGGNPTIVKAQLALDAAARTADVAVVPDCGLAPGYANVMAAGMIAESGGRTADVQIRVGVLPQLPTGALKYQLAFNASGLINEYAEPCEIIDDGVVRTVNPLDRLEELQWAGLGTLEAFSTAGGTSTMPDVYAGKVDRLEYKTIRFPGHQAIFVAFRELGFFSTMAPDHGMAPRELLTALLAKNLPSGEPDVTLMSVSITTAELHRELRLEDRHDGRFSSLARTTAFPTTALCDLVARGEVDFRGAAAMHSVAEAARLDRELQSVGITPNGCQ